MLFLLLLLNKELISYLGETSLLLSSWLNFYPGNGAYRDYLSDFDSECVGDMDKTRPWGCILIGERDNWFYC